MQQIRAGISTWVGIGVGVLALVPPLATGVIDDIENVSAHWNGAEKASLISGAAIVAITLLGRFGQAVAAILKEGLKQ